MITTPSWNDLRALRAVYLFGGAVQAAASLGVSHQTISRRIGSLEDSLNIRLVNRSKTGWVLTSSGMQIAEMVEGMDTSAQKIERFVRTNGVSLSGRIGITSVPWGFELLILPSLKGVQSKYPNLFFDLVSSDDHIDVEIGGTDLALRFTNCPPQNLIGRKIGVLKFGVYGAKPMIEALDEGRRSEVTLVRVKGMAGPHVDWLESAGDFVNVTTVSDFETLVKAVRFGLGVALLPHSVARNCPSLACSKNHVPESTMPVWILRSQESRGSETIKAVESEIVRLGREILGSDAPY